jgi:large repetitive protein
MLEGFDVGGWYATPTFADIDNDGDLDAFVGETNGTVKFYQNTGSASAPSFTPANGTTIINPLTGFNVGSYAAPTFADIDNDGDLDLFVGEIGGTVKFYQNSGDASNPSFVAADGTGVINPLSGFDVGNMSTPTFADIDNDGDLDAFIGERLGTVKYYRNNSTPTLPTFVPDVAGNPLAGFDMGYYVSPTFADIDNDGDLDAFVGTYDGTVAFYQNNGPPSAPNFVSANGTTIINPLVGLDMGRYWAGPAFVDIDNDGDLDAFVGTYGGAIRFYRNDGSAASPNFAASDDLVTHNALARFDVGRYSAPTFVDIDNDGDLDAFVGTRNGMVMFYQNDGTPSAPSFTAANGTSIINPLTGVTGFYTAPSFVDIDNDGDLDAFVGESGGTVKFYQNNGGPGAPSFVATNGTSVINPLAGVSVGRNAIPTFADIDNDGDLDAFVSENNSGSVKFYQNNGDATMPSFVPADGTTIINPLAGFVSIPFPAPTFADIDHDGDLDLFVGERSGTVKFYQNTGGISAPSFAAADGVTIINPLAGFGVGFNFTPTFADIDNDGDLDLFSGERGGTIRFFENHEFEPISGSSGGGSGGGGSPGLIFLALLTALLPGGLRARLQR